MSEIVVRRKWKPIRKPLNVFDEELKSMAAPSRNELRPLSRVYKAMQTWIAASWVLGCHSLISINRRRNSNNNERSRKPPDTLRLPLIISSTVYAVLLYYSIAISSLQVSWVPGSTKVLFEVACTNKRNSTYYVTTLNSRESYSGACAPIPDSSAAEKLWNC